jgi:hypothetical protein
MRIYCPYCGMQFNKMLEFNNVNHIDNKNRKDWSLLRYNYYSAGRNEMLLGNYSAAGILLGYAVETSFKHALMEFGFIDQVILNKHEPQILMRKCRDLGVLEGAEVSDDFLDYINDHLKPRYPSLKAKVQEDILGKGRVDIIGPLLLSWYDDLMYQIDNWLIETTADSLSSCFFRATGDLDSLKGKLFFHSNYHGCSSVEKYIAMRKNHVGDNSYIISKLENGIESLWSTVTGILPAQRYDNVNYSSNFSKRFHYPKWSEESSIQLKNWNCIMINLLPWE